MMTQKMKYLTFVGVVLSISLGIAVFGGSILLSNLLIDNDSGIGTQDPTESTPPADASYSWTPNSIKELMDEMELREDNLTFIAFTSEKLVEAEGEEPQYKPHNVFWNGELLFTGLIAYPNLEQWRIDLKGETEAYFYLELSTISQINDKFPASFSGVDVSTEYQKIMDVNSEEFKSIPQERFFEITHCYDDGSAIVLKLLLITNTDGSVFTTVVTIGTWQYQEDKLVVTPNDNNVYVARIIYESHSQFEHYYGVWIRVIEEATLQFLE